MIIGMALKEVFKDLKIDDISVQFHFGDQKEFNHWVVSKMKAKKQKYPLIWYVISSPEPQGNGKLRVEAQLTLFQGNEKTQQLNDQRYTYTYLTYLEPLYKEVSKRLKGNKFITLLDAYNGIKYTDIPNYGIDLATAQIPTDGVNVVDAKVMRFRMDITPNCIISNAESNNPNPPSFVCENGNKYIDISQVFVNPFTPSLQTDIRLLTSSEIIDLWLDNENYTNGLGGARVFICLNSFEIGSNVYSGSSNELIGSFFDGYWLANQSGFSGTGSQNGININYRYNPIRSTPYGINNPITNPPLPFTFFADTVEPVIIKIEAGIVTEIIPLPMTGFAYEG